MATPFSRSCGLVVALGRWTVALACGAASPMVHATEDADQLFFADMPIVLSASRLPQPLADSPGAVTVLDADLIRSTGYRSLPDLLRLVPGYNVAWLRGWWGVVNYHGLSGEFSNRVLVRVDDRPVNSEYWTGGIDWMSLPVDVDDIERIEVLRGSNSTSFGTNAFLGVINIRTKPPDAAAGTGVRLSGGDGVRDAVLHANFGGGPGGARLTVGHRGDRGLDNLQDDSRANFFNLRADLSRDADSFGLAMGGLDGTAGEGYATDSLNPTRNRNARTSFQQLHWTRQLQGQGAVWLQWYHNRERYVDEGLLPLLSGGGLTLADNNRTAERQSLEFRHRFQWSVALRATWGLEWHQDKLYSRAYFGTDAAPTRTTRRLSAEVEWRAAPQLLVNGGAMVESVSGAGTRVSPRLFANYEIAAGHVLRAGFSSATRAPTLFESYANQVATSQGVPLDINILGNPNLVPERIRALELGYYGRSRDARYEADVRIYREYLRDLVTQIEVTPPGPILASGGYSYTNADSATITGLSYQLKARPWPDTQLLFSHSLERIAQDQLRLRHSAPSSAFSMAWIQRFGPAWSASLIHYRVGAIDWLEFGERIEPYQRTDVRLAYRFRRGPTRGELAVSALNLFGSYNEFRNGPPDESHQFSRRVFATLRLEY